MALDEIGTDLLPSIKTWYAVIYFKTLGEEHER
jgi:hypothetical protein